MDITSKIEQATKQLLQFEKTIAIAVSKTNELSAELKILKKELKEKYGVNDLESANKKLLELEEIVEKEQIELTDLIEELEDDFEKFQK